ncbi:undecaprenyl phosphate translocase family protein [Ornithobacterium rhinotracheale]
MCSVVCLISFSKLMGYFLKHYHDIVMGWLMGFIIGSLVAAWPWKTIDLNPQ